LEDFHFNLDIDALPQLFLTESYYCCYEENEGIPNREWFQLTGDQNNFTLSKTLYSSYVGCDEIELEVSVQAINYFIQDKFMVCYFSFDSWSYCNWAN